jgi:dipeptidyl aminopeptidase/acylaminoacyl peptidase
VYLSGLDGAPPRLLAPLAPGHARSVGRVAWSPDGSRIAFDQFGDVECTAKKPFLLRFTIAGVDAGPPHAVAALGHGEKLVALANIRWSPSGLRLLYLVYSLDNEGDPNTCRWHRPFSRLFTIAANGRDRHRLAEGEITAAAWAPSGANIAFVDCSEATDAGCDLYVTRGAATRRVGKVGSSSDIAWTPRGDEILVTYSDGLWAVDPVTRKERVIARWSDAQYPGSVLAFSSDGRSVGVTAAYPIADRPRLALFVASLDGSGSKRFPLPPVGMRGSVYSASLHLP